MLNLLLMKTKMSQAKKKSPRLQSERHQMSQTAKVKLLPRNQLRRNHLMKMKKKSKKLRETVKKKEKEKNYSLET
jgi:hypothetical protein